MSSRPRADRPRPRTPARPSGHVRTTLRRDLALLILRLGLEAVFVLHGAQKLLGAFGGEGISGTADGFAQMGLEPGTLWADVAGVGELGGGALLLLGLLTPLGALSVGVSMVVATGSSGFFNQGGGWEHNVVLIVMSLVVLLLGPGRLSLDRALGLDRLPERLRGCRRGAAASSAAAPGRPATA